MDRHTDATKVLSFRVPTEHAEWVATKAEEAGMSMNKALRLWLAQAVKDSE